MDSHATMIKLTTNGVIELKIVIREQCIINCEKLFERQQRKLM